LLIYICQSSTQLLKFDSDEVISIIGDATGSADIKRNANALAFSIINESANDVWKDPPSENRLDFDIESFELGSEYEGKRPKRFQLSILF
jgi:hypothetical protein